MACFKVLRNIYCFYKVNSCCLFKVQSKESKSGKPKALVTLGLECVVGSSLIASCSSKFCSISVSVVASPEPSVWVCMHAQRHTLTCRVVLQMCLINGLQWCKWGKNLAYQFVVVQKGQSSGKNAERQGCYSEGPNQAGEMSWGKS